MIFYDWRGNQFDAQTILKEFNMRIDPQDNPNADGWVVGSLRERFGVSSLEVQLAGDEGASVPVEWWIAGQRIVLFTNSNGISDLRINTQDAAYQPMNGQFGLFAAKPQGNAEKLVGMGEIFGLMPPRIPEGSNVANNHHVIIPTFVYRKAQGTSVEDRLFNLETRVRELEQWKNGSSFTNVRPHSAGRYLLQ